LREFSDSSDYRLGNGSEIQELLLKVRKSSILLIASLWWLSGVGLPLYAQEVKPTNRPADAGQQETKQTPAADDDRPNAETIALRAELRVIREYETSLLTTVIWALGINIFVLLAIVGLGWYTNVRVYKRDIDNVRQDLLTFLQGERKGIQNELEIKVNCELNSFKEQADRMRTDLSETVRSTTEPLSKRLERQEQALRRQDYSLEYLITDLEGKRLENSKSHIKALAAYVQKLELARRMNVQADILSSVDDLARVIKSRREEFRTSGLADRPAIDPVTSLDIVKVLEQLPDTYLERTQEIYELLGVPHEAPTVPVLSRLDSSS
jgi:hypothetical protein